MSSLGGYLSYVLSVHLHIDLFLGLLITIPAMFVLGAGHPHQWLIRPLHGPERTSMSLLACFAVAIILEGALYWIFGPNAHAHGVLRQRPASRWPGSISATSTCTASRSRSPGGGDLPLLYRSRFGRAVRATMQDTTAARLVGIDVNRVAALTFGIGVAVTAAGGMAYGATSGGFNPNSGYDLISRLLAIIILGGLGSIGGALAAAIFMITVESLVDIWSPNWAIVVFYAALVIVLTIRPSGLFGRARCGPSEPVRPARRRPPGRDPGPAGARCWPRPCWPCCWPRSPSSRWCSAIRSPPPTGSTR